jgi:iron only hydrogenase large subunit-like protein
VHQTRYPLPHSAKRAANKHANTAQNAYEVTTEEKAAAAEPPPPAQISLTDCLACSGCVTSAEAVLVQLQSHNEVLSTLDAHAELHAPWAQNGTSNGSDAERKLFVASLSPQARASLAAVFGVTDEEAGNMVQQLLSGPLGVKKGGRGSGFQWVLDTEVLRDVCLVAAADEVMGGAGKTAAPMKPGAEGAIDTAPKQPILTSACPGWICYAEKTHPYVLPHLSRLKSPQALTGTLVKSVLNQRFGVSPSQVWHLAIMPCFDKKLEASRSELTSAAWLPGADPVRDVDCVITARELLQLAEARGISFSSLPRTPLPAADRTSFPDPKLDAFLFPAAHPKTPTTAAGPSGGYLYHILSTYQSAHPGSSITVTRGRNADVVEYSLTQGPETIVRMARFYGFRNIQNLVRRLKPARASRLPGGKTGVSRRPGAAANGDSNKDYAYVEVMACPGGCTNGGGQIKVGEVDDVRAAEGLGPLLEGTAEGARPGPKEQKEWLGRVDEAYFSGDETDDTTTTTNGHTPTSEHDADVVNNISRSRIAAVLAHWSDITGVDPQALLYTSYRKVESDVGKKVSDVERVAGLAVSVGGGW